MTLPHRVLRPLARTAILAALLACAACAASTDGRGRLYAAGDDDPVQRELREPARMTVVFWPALGQCMPTEIALMESFDTIQSTHPDIRFLTVIPDVPRDKVLRYGRPLPGKVLRLDPDRYEAQNRLGPRPRVEVWSQKGELLLLRSVPPLLPRARALADEVEWSLYFTSPLETTAEAAS